MLPPSPRLEQNAQLAGTALLSKVFKMNHPSWQALGSVHIAHHEAFLRVMRILAHTASSTKVVKGIPLTSAFAHGHSLVMSLTSKRSRCFFSVRRQNCIQLVSFDVRASSALLNCLRLLSISFLKQTAHLVHLDTDPPGRWS